VKKNSVLYFVASDCDPKLEEKFNKWFDEVHIPLLLKFKKLKSVLRYKLTKPGGEIASRFKPTENWPKYLTVYEFEDLQAAEEYLTSAELEAARQEMQGTWKEGEVEVRWRAHYQIINRVVKS
jgi:hypothetical protein